MYKLSLRKLFDNNTDDSDDNDNYNNGNNTNTQSSSITNSSKKQKTQKKQKQSGLNITPNGTIELETSATRASRVVSPKCEPASSNRSTTPNLELDIVKNDLRTSCENKNPQMLSSYFKINLDDLFDSKKDKIKLSTDDVLSIITNILETNQDTKKLSRYFLNNSGDLINTDISKSKTTLVLHKSFIHKKIEYGLNKLMKKVYEYYVSEIVYTDGSLKRKGVGNISKFGYYRNNDISISQPMISETTNNQCELLAIYTALVDVYLENIDVSSKGDDKKVKIISIVSDSEYAINSLTKWKEGWIKNNWKNSKNEPVKNRNILEGIIAISKKLYKQHIIVNYIHQNSHIKLETLCDLNKELQSYISNQYSTYLREKRTLWNSIDSTNGDSNGNHDTTNTNSRLSPSLLLNIATYINNDSNYDNILTLINNDESTMEISKIIKLINTIQFIKGNYVIDFLVQN
jgi:ribonuclease HI